MSRRTRQATDRGFSFIELLAYMAIAALLILAAVPQFGNYRGKAMLSTMLGDANNLGLAVEAREPDATADRADIGQVKLSPSNTARLGALGGGEAQVTVRNPAVPGWVAVWSSANTASLSAGVNLRPAVGHLDSPVGTEVARDDFSGTGDLLGQLSSTGKPWEGTAGMFLQEGGRAIGQTRSGYVTTEAPASASRTVTVKGVRLDTSPRASASQVLVYTNHVTRGRTLFMFLNVDAKGGARWGLWELTSGKSAAVLDAGVLKLEPNTVNTFDMSVTTTGKTFTIAAAGQTRTGTLSDATHEALKGGNGFGIGGSPLMQGVSFESISVTSNPQ